MVDISFGFWERVIFLILSYGIYGSGARIRGGLANL